VFRVVWIDRFPGINGDEAWYGVVVNRYLSGKDMSWRTPTGNWLNPLYVGLLGWVRLVFPARMWVLRLPAVISGASLMIVTMKWGRKIWGKELNKWLVVLVSVIPIDIAYSRFGWDTSQAGLAAMVVLMSVFRENWKWMFVAVVGSLVIHPSMVFLTPVIWGVMVGSVWKTRKKMKKMELVKVMIGVGLVIVVWKATVGFDEVRVMNSDRVLNLETWVEYGRFWGDVMNGIAVYEYIGGGVVQEWKWLLNGVWWLGVMPLLVWAMKIATESKEWKWLGMMVGLIVGGVMFLGLGGVSAIGIGYERYVVWMVVPVLLWWAYGMEKLLEKVKRRKIMELGWLMGVGVWLMSFWVGYFDPYMDNSRKMHRTFWSGKVEPKQQVVDWLERNGEGRAVVVAENWWVYWPVRYGLGEDERWKVVNVEDLDEDLINERDKVFWVGFADGPLDDQINEEADFVAEDENGEAILKVWKRLM